MLLDLILQLLTECFIRFCYNYCRTCTMNVEHEVKLLVQELKRLGIPGPDGKITVKFGVLFNDDRCANIFEGAVHYLFGVFSKR